jgi:hypothetical protein
MTVGGREMQERKFVDEVWNSRNYEGSADLHGETCTNAFGAGPAARTEPIRGYHERFLTSIWTLKT